MQEVVDFMLTVNGISKHFPLVFDLRGFGIQSCVASQRFNCSDINCSLVCLSEGASWNFFGSSKSINWKLCTVRVDRLGKLVLLSFNDGEKWKGGLEGDG